MIEKQIKDKSNSDNENSYNSDDFQSFDENIGNNSKQSSKVIDFKNVGNKIEIGSDNSFE